MRFDDLDVDTLALIATKASRYQMSVLRCDLPTAAKLSQCCSRLRAIVQPRILAEVRTMQSLGEVGLEFTNLTLLVPLISKAVAAEAGPALSFKHLQCYDGDRELVPFLKVLQACRAPLRSIHIEDAAGSLAASSKLMASFATLESVQIYFEKRYARNDVLIAFAEALRSERLPSLVTLEIEHAGDDGFARLLDALQSRPNAVSKIGLRNSWVTDMRPLIKILSQGNQSQLKAHQLELTLDGHRVDAAQMRMLGSALEQLVANRTRPPCPFKHLLFQASERNGPRDDESQLFPLLLKLGCPQNRWVQYAAPESSDDEEQGSEGSADLNADGCSDFDECSDEEDSMEED